LYFSSPELFGKILAIKLNNAQNILHLHIGFAVYLGIKTNYVPDYFPGKILRKKIHPEQVQMPELALQS